MAAQAALPYDTLVNALRYWHRHDSTRPAFVFRDRHGGRSELSYGQVSVPQKNLLTGMQNKGVIMVWNLSLNKDKSLQDIHAYVRERTHTHTHARLRARARTHARTHIRTRAHAHIGRGAYSTTFMDDFQHFCVCICIRWLFWSSDLSFLGDQLHTRWQTQETDIDLRRHVVYQPGTTD